ncbi:MAG TPA: cell wall-binding repeat-containing protein [Bacillales bacterium]|nr:cell wall-binding repeat-containing protein [Bacillales bacterium]
MKKLLSALLVLFVFAIAAGTASADGTTNRIDGNDRFDVSIKLSNQGFPSGASTVILANYSAFADALAATPLAYYLNAPILLTEPNQLNDKTKNEIVRLHPTEVVIVGGTASVSDTIVNELKALPVQNVRRIDGANRYEVSSNIAIEMPASAKVVVAYGENFPDALSIAPYAAKNGYPILLTGTSALPDEVQQTIAKRKPSGSIIVGGEGSISKNVESELPSVTRIGGNDRYEVSANIVRTLNLPSTTAYVATGNTFADALTGSVVAAKQNSPILLTNNSSIPQPIRLLVADKDIHNFIVLGGTGSVAQIIPNQLTGPLARLKIVVDAGHGGKDVGAIGFGKYEKNITLAIANKLRPKFEAAGAAVVMTRESDTYPSLDDRVNIANSQHANSFISIHSNSSTSPAPSGTETYWNSVYSGTQSKALAQSIQSQLVNYMGTVNRGVKEDDFRVIKATTMPSVLVEVAFISNAVDNFKLNDPTYQENAAQAIYIGTLNYYKK